MADASNGDDVLASEDNLTERSNALVLAAANMLDEDTLDLDVGLGPDAARLIATRRPFKKIETLRTLLTARQLRLLLDYARTNGVGPSPSGSASAYATGSASASPSGSADAGWFSYDAGNWRDSGQP